MKHNDAVIRQYCRAVGKQLPLPAAQRRQLLAGLREEFTESAQGCTTLDELIARVGTPDESAQELLSGIAPERVHAYQKKRRWRSHLAAVLIVLAVCCAALIYAQVLTDSSAAYAEEHIPSCPRPICQKPDNSLRRTSNLCAPLFPQHTNPRASFGCARVPFYRNILIDLQPLPRRWFRPPGLAVCCAGPLPGRRIGAGWTGPAPEEPRP